MTSSADYAEHHSYDHDLDDLFDPARDISVVVCAQCGVHEDAHNRPERYGWGYWAKPGEWVSVTPTFDHAFEAKRMQPNEAGALQRAFMETVKA